MATPKKDGVVTVISSLLFPTLSAFKQLLVGASSRIREAELESTGECACSHFRPSFFFSIWMFPNRVVCQLEAERRLEEK